MPLSEKHLAQFIEYLRTNKNYSIHTLTAYKNDINVFQQYFRTAKVAENQLDKYFGDQFRLYLQSLRSQDISNRSIARKQSALKRYLKFLYAVKITDSDWSSRIRRVKYSTQLPEVASQEQIKEIIEMPSGDKLWSLRDRAILELFYSSGIRLTELSQLSFTDIDLKTQVIKVLGKGRKERLVPIGKTSSQCLSKYIEKRNNELKKSDSSAVFINQRGTKLSARSVGRIVRKYSSASGFMKKFSPHSFRHAFATHLLDEGADLTAVKDLLGHESLSSTQLYTHISLKRLKEVYKKTHPRA